MKKQTKILLILVCLMAILSVALFAACDETIIVTVKLNLEGNDDQTLQVGKNAEFYSLLSQFVPQDTNGLTLEGWVDENGTPVTADTRWEQDGTVIAVWSGAHTIKFDKNNESATGAMPSMTVLHDETVKLAANAFSSSYEFGGWNTKADGSGEYYPDGHNLYVTGDVTLYAQWKVSYAEEIWVETFDGENYVYVKYKDATLDGFLGNGVSVKTVLKEEDYQKLVHGSHYFVDEAVEGSKTSATSLQNGDVLKAYYSIERLTIVYAEDDESFEFRYGDKYAIRASDVANSVMYCTSPSGDGKAYDFGQEITVTESLTLFPVVVEVFTDANGSGDKVEIRKGATGLGAATLIKDGKSYKGFLEVNGITTTFEVNVRENDQDNGVTYFGKLLNDGTFVYRNEDEVGVYVWYDYLFGDIYTSVMLNLDGYGTGVFAVPEEGTERTANYYVEYQATEDGDYYMQYFLPADPSKVYEDYFDIVREQSEEYPKLAGYFMLWGYEYGEYILVYNWEAQEQGLYLDGYGNAVMFEFDENGDIYDDYLIEGVYYASDDYTDDEPEYIFVVDGDFENALVFTAVVLPNGDDYLYIFFIKRGEAGVYTQEADVKYPELYLDGYGGAEYKSEENDKGRVGFYTIDSDGNGGYSVLITFEDEAGGKMRVTLDTVNHLFVNNTVGDLVIVDGVVTEYLGESTVIEIPEGVTEIADGVFKNKNITTLTLPSTIEKIGLYAFQNSASATEHSLLTTIYIKAQTPPVLADDPNAEGAPNPFRWLQDNAKIIVPDGCEDAYKQAESWSRYVKYITTRAILNNKPLFEIDENGVLLSYNNKDENPENVTITIPDEVVQIADGVFASLEYIVSVDLNNVTVIGDRAFYGCINLASVTFNASTVSIGDSAFYQCTALTELDLGNVQTIGASAFNRCFNLAKVNVGSQITSIGDYAFAMCSVEVSEDESMIVPSDLVLTMNAATAPTMGGYVFKLSQPRIYVDSFETGVNYAKNAHDTNWAGYVTSLRVKSETDEIRYYSKTNMGAPLVLNDRADFDNGSYIGLYKIEGGYIYITWLNYSKLTNVLVIEEQRASADANGEYVGFVFDDVQFVFVPAGKQITFNHINGSETLKITYGESEATFNGATVALEIGNNVTRFTKDGYYYNLTLYATNEFSYKKEKVTYTVAYTAEDGSTLTVTFGNLNKAVGMLKNVDGEERYTETGWYIFATEESNVYTGSIPYLNMSYSLTVVLNDEDNTFTYSISGGFTRTTYRDGENYVVVTNHATGKVDIQFNFITANGQLDCNCDNVQAVAGKQNTYAVTIDITIDVVDDEGNVTGQVPSELNGNYQVTLNSNGTYTLTATD